MKMTKAELISLLEDYPDEAEIRIMTQPGWPMVEVAAGVISKAELALYDRVEGADYGEEMDEDVDEVPDVIYLIADGHPSDECYGDKRAWDEMRRP